jgi:hypothetical protein
MSDYSTMKMGELIAARKENHDKLSDANKVAQTFKDEEDLIDAAIIIKLEAEGSKRAASDVGSVSLMVTEEPNVDDWETLYAHIKATGDFSLLQRRPTSTSMREIWKLGQAVPGVSSRTVKRINFRSS